ncbi:hypothetical protein UFOVP728_3 [uncultured Caudovirales phage]|uniref:Uncharacterized protein n=1 Tax=uncultured Caudovirales phage TaxID=2100421 RepID=A0A6J5NL78_9CAUD|nr:hypothetical protein UFOVP728_3 [uncultured Caudovirales phage]
MTSKAWDSKVKLSDLVALDGLTSGVWVRAPSIFRLRLTGTGTVTLDARNKLNVVTTSVASFVTTSATNQIEFPYLGDDAYEMRATFPASMTVEVLA